MYPQSWRCQLPTLIPAPSAGPSTVLVEPPLAGDRRRCRGVLTCWEYVGGETADPDDFSYHVSGLDTGSYDVHFIAVPCGRGLPALLVERRPGLSPPPPPCRLLMGKTARALIRTSERKCHFRGRPRAWRCVRRREPVAEFSSPVLLRSGIQMIPILCTSGGAQISMRPVAMS